MEKLKEIMGFIHTRTVEAWSLKAPFNEPVVFWLMVAIAAVFLLFIVFNVMAMVREKRDERRAAEDRVRRQQRYEWEFRHLPEIERRIQVYLALQADMYLPRMELPIAAVRQEPRLTE